MMDAKGIITTRYTYDAAGRLVREGSKTYRYGYLDKVMSVTDNGSTYTYEYHADGQLAGVSHVTVGSRVPRDRGHAGRATLPCKSEDFLWDGPTPPARAGPPVPRAGGITGIMERRHVGGYACLLEYTDRIGESYG